MNNRQLAMFHMDEKNKFEHVESIRRLAARFRTELENIHFFDEWATEAQIEAVIESENFMKQYLEWAQKTLDRLGQEW